jgi:cell division initiation protein
MITPLDIQNKDFKKTLRGYNAKSVDIFLDEINEDFERIYKDNIELKDKINMLSDQLRQYNTMEETLKSTLIVAQTTADEVTSNARQKAETIIENAELTSKKIIDQAREDVRNIKNEYDYLKKEIFIFKTRYQSFIQAQLISLEEFYSQVESKDRVPSVIASNEAVEEDNIEVDNLGA